MLSSIDPNNYRNIPSLAAYIDRIGAEQRNFRRFIVKLEGKNRYHYDKVIITIDSKDGSIRCVIDGKVVKKDSEYLPTDAERAKIKEALADPNIKWPHSMPTGLANIYDLKKLIAEEYGRSDPTLFVFLDATGKKVLFVQERVIRKDDELKKDDLPWSYWSDKKWRCMEPEGLLPLWGLPALRDAAHVVIHEGAKTARFVKAMFGKRTFDDIALVEKVPHLADCPWANDLELAAHIGWPGGAPNPHRVDWEPIRKLGRDVEVTIVADNDKSGEDAVPKISQALQRRCSVLRFGGDFPKHFDLADQFPEKLFTENKGLRVYVGPSFDGSWSPATWATRFDFATKQFTLREEFAAEWISCVVPSLFIHRNRLDLRYDKESFHKRVSPFSDVNDVAALLNKLLSAQADGLVYEPGRPSGLITFDRRQMVNVYRPLSLVRVMRRLGSNLTNT
jgi:hypothetical protein